MVRLEQSALAVRQNLPCLERGRILLVPMAEILYLKAEKSMSPRASCASIAVAWWLATLLQESSGRRTRARQMRAGKLFWTELQNACRSVAGTGRS